MIGQIAVFHVAEESSFELPKNVFLNMRVVTNYLFARSYVMQKFAHGYHQHIFHLDQLFHGYQNQTNRFRKVLLLTKTLGSFVTELQHVKKECLRAKLVVTYQTELL